MECSKKITEDMKLSAEDCELAQIIGLLHDIGRFEQLKCYNSFEPGTMDHAAFGVRILFEERLIRRFVEENKWDEIIKTAIGHHSDYCLKGITNERELMHAQIIRDADKLDNCRVKLETAIETLLGVTAEQVGMSEITPEVMRQFKNHKFLHLLQIIYSDIPAHNILLRHARFSFCKFVYDKVFPHDSHARTENN